MSNMPPLFSPDANQPPNSWEGEQAVLGSILINAECLIDVRPFLKGDDFFLAKHKWIWEAICTLADSQPPQDIDNVTVTQILHDCKQLEDIGGPSYITELINNTPTHIHAVAYGRIVERAAIRRRLLDACGDIAKIALEENAEIQTVLSKADERLNAVTSLRIDADDEDFEPIAKSIDTHWESVTRRTQEHDEGKLSGASTGFFDLDRVMGGSQPGDLIVPCGRPGMGKTSFILSISLNMAKAGKKVGFITREMSTDSLLNRMTSMESGINSQKFRTGDLTREELSLYYGTAADVRNLPIFINEKVSTTVGVRRVCEKLAAKHGLDMLCVDYLQLLKVLGFKGNREQEVAEIARFLKMLAKDLRIPIYAPAQLSRKGEEKADKRPALDHLRETGEIENSADIVMGIYRDDYYNENSDRPNQADILFLKNRNGPRGVVTLYFRQELTLFANMTKSTVNVNTGEIF